MNLSSSMEKESLKMAKKSVYRLSKKGMEHDAIEHWLGKHNRKFEMLRTLTGLVSASASSLVLLKVFGAI